MTIPGPEVFSTLFKGAGADPGVLSASPPPCAPATRPAMDTGARRPRPGVADDAERAEPGRRRATTGCSGVQSKGEARLDTVTANLATAENIDLPKTIIDMQIQQTAYQAALGATAKIIQPSLVDFLR